MAQSFNGTSSYIEWADDPSFNTGTGDLTVVFFMHATTTLPDQARVVSHGTSSGGSKSNPGRRFELYATSSSLNFAIDDASTKSEATWSSGPTIIDDGSPHMILGERDQTNVKIFTGEAGTVTERSSAGDNTNNTIDNGQSLLLGAGRTTSDTVVEFSDLDVWEFAIFDRVLSADEKQILALGHAPTSLRPGPVFYAPLVRGDNDRIAGLTGTSTSVTVSDHGRVIMPSRRSYAQPAFLAATIKVGSESVGVGVTDSSRLTSLRPQVSEVVSLGLSDVSTNLCLIVAAPDTLPIGLSDVGTTPIAFGQETKVASDTIGIGIIQVGDLVDAMGTPRTFTAVVPISANVYSGVVPISANVETETMGISGNSETETLVI